MATITSMTTMKTMTMMIKCDYERYKDDDDNKDDE